MFNGLSVFGLRGSRHIQKLGGVIIDDAHASLDSIREAFSLSIPAEGSDGLYRNILSEFREAFENMDRSSTFHELMQGIGGDIVEIPYWRWLSKSEYISDLIRTVYRKRLDSDDEFSNNLRFKWPLLKDNLKYCQVIASRTGITITSLYPMVDMVPAFARARHRIFMSATITDYGDMIRAYDLRDLTEDSVIAPKTVAGVGRRMILDLPRDVSQSHEFTAFAKNLAESGRGVVRLVSRTGTDDAWPSIGFVEPLGHHDVLAAVSALQAGNSAQPVSFVNRYNGIDLPGDSCRLLIMRGLPSGGDDYDSLMSTYLDDSEIRTQRLAQRIEQGLGRGTRGASDHCVVLLEGEDLVDWVKRTRNRKYFTPALRVQLDMGEAIGGSLQCPKDYCDAMRQDLNDDDDWKKYHASKLAKAASIDMPDRFGVSCEIARAERRAFACWREHGNDESYAALIKGFNLNELDDGYKGWLSHLASRIAFDGGKGPLAEHHQQQAHSFNSALPYFPFILEQRFSAAITEQAKMAAEMLRRSGGRLDAVARFDRDTADLQSGIPHNQFENALMKLGQYAGFESGRADNNGDGPDVYWVAPDGVGFALEAKNEKDADTPLHKKEAGQLRTARDWMAQKWPCVEVYPVSVQPSLEADQNASATNLYVLTLESLGKLKEAIRNIVIEGSSCLDGNTEIVISRCIANLGLSGKSVFEKYTATFVAASCN